MSDGDFPEVTPVFVDSTPSRPARVPSRPNRAKPPVRFAVAVGPVPPEDPEPFEQIYSLLSSPSDRSDYTLSFYPTLPCFAIEVPDYSRQDPLIALSHFQYKGQNVFITKTDVERFQSNADRILPEIPHLITDETLDLSEADSKFNLVFWSGSHIQALLSYAFLQCHQYGMVDRSSRSISRIAKSWTVQRYTRLCFFFRT
jgi:hypothetical protein